jgi:hypothetical protein
MNSTGNVCFSDFARSWMLLKFNMSTSKSLPAAASLSWFLACCKQSFRVLDQACSDHRPGAVPAEGQLLSKQLLPLEAPSLRTRGVLLGVAPPDETQLSVAP